MKDDNNKPDMKTWIDPELEARVVAWVAGEASPFEIAELERIVAAQPELAVFKLRIEAVHGLVREAARPDPTPLLLAPERRAKLLAVLEGTEKKEAAPAALATEKPKVIPFYAGWQRVVGRYAWVGGVAAMAVFGVFVATRKTFSSSEAKVRVNRERQMNESVKLMVMMPNTEEEKAKETVDAAIVTADVLSARSSFQLQSPDLAGADLNYKQEAQRRATEQTGDLSRMKGITVGGFQGGGQMADYYVGGGRGGGGGGRDLPASAPAKAKALEIDQVRSLGAVTFGQADADRGQAAARPFGYTFNGTAGKNQSQAGESSLTLGTLSTSNRQATIGGAAGGVLTNSGSNQFYSGATTLNGSGAVVGGVIGSVTDARTRDLADAVAGSPPVKMEAFVVNEERNDGYFAANTLSGTRMSSSISPPLIPMPAPTLNIVAQDAIADYARVAPAAKAGRGGFSGSFGGGAKKDLSLAATTVLPPPPGGPDINLPVNVASLQAAPSLAKTNASTPPTVLRGFIGQQLDKETDDQKRPVLPAPAEPPSTEETSTAKEPVSTFSLHVSDVSFRLAQSALARGQLPDATLIRPEEIYNAFDYGDPSTPAAEKVGIRIEQSAHPFLQQRNLVRIAVKVPATGRNATQPLKLTVLLDTSGSMEREDRVTTVRRAMEVLCSLLGPQDRVTLIGFARQPRLLAEDVAGDRAKGLLDLIARTPAEGGTNLEAALKLGGELARRHRQLSAQNRIVVLTDGAANLGDADPARLAAMVEELRNQGIAFDACGVGLNGLDDAMLEPLTRKGDGRYYVLDSADSADAGFARQLAGAFRPAAENVKLQVRFNPARVANYRLIGFEKHRLKTEDFRNDRVDAAELAAEEAAVAVYQVEALPSGEGELGEVSVRFRDASDSTMVERTWTMIYDAQAPAFNRAAPSLQLAGVAALVAEKLRGSPQADQFQLGDFAGVVNGLRSHYASQVRVQEFATMFASLRRIRGE